MSKTFLNQVQLARRWHLSPRTLERWRWEGIGPHFLKNGGRVVYDLADIEGYEISRVQKCIHTDVAPDHLLVATYFGRTY